jgi:hypothetical protein
VNSYTSCHFGRKSNLSCPEAAFQKAQNLSLECFETSSGSSSRELKFKFFKLLTYGLKIAGPSAGLLRHPHMSYNFAGGGVFTAKRVFLLWIQMNKLVGEWDRSYRACQLYFGKTRLAFSPGLKYYHSLTIHCGILPRLESMGSHFG